MRSHLCTILLTWIQLKNVKRNFKDPARKALVIRQILLLFEISQWQQKHVLEWKRRKLFFYFSDNSAKTCFMGLKFQERLKSSICFILNQISMYSTHFIPAGQIVFKYFSTFLGESKGLKGKKASQNSLVMLLSQTKIF